jgi:hypothetical protein
VCNYIIKIQINKTNYEYSRDKLSSIPQSFGYCILALFYGKSAKSRPAVALHNYETASAASDQSSIFDSIIFMLVEASITHEWQSPTQN